MRGTEPEGCGVYRLMTMRVTGALLLLGLISVPVGCHRSGPVFASADPNALPCSKSAGYFPKGVLFFGDDQGEMDSGYLRLMGEGSFYQCPAAGTEPVLRFLWDRSMSPPISVRLSVHPDGSGTLLIRMLAHPAFPPPPAPGERAIDPRIWYQRTLDRRKNIKSEKVDKVLALVGRIAFITNHGGPVTTDGSDWIFETEEAGSYRVVDFRNEPPQTAKTLGLYMVRELGGLALSENEIY
jgi:hypothetical protein